MGDSRRAEWQSWTIIALVGPFVVAAAALVSGCGDDPLPERGEALGQVSQGASKQSKVTICHRPPGNPANAHTITVGAPAVDAHLAHGDTLGACEAANPCANVVCVPIDQCHEAGACDPATGQCSSPPKADGTACDDASACTHTDVCDAGTCTGADPVVCTALDDCHEAGSCDPSSSACTDPEKVDGSGCDDGDACSQSDSCQAGVCTGGDFVTCEPPDQCHDAGSCDPAAGLCDNPAKQDGAGCDDGSACTSGDTCQAGSCKSGSPTACVPLDQCHEAGVCDDATGTCSNPTKEDGAACDDGNRCTQIDACQTGSCTGTSAVECMATDQCHVAGSCDPASGLCSNPAKDDGAACDDGDSCSTGDTCAAGICVAGAAPNCDDGNLCTDDACDPATGCVSTNNQAPCDDGNACTQADSCVAGSCSGADPIVCVALDDCHDPGTCHPVTGACSEPEKTDGSPCNDADACSASDSCQAGVCTGGDLVTCQPSDQCHDAGSCDSASGVCSNPAKEDGAACDDGNACSTRDACAAGVCVAGLAVNCDDANVCTDDACDPASGCVRTNNTAPCDDGNACTQADGCVAGTCSGDDEITCVALDDCHEVGACDPATGECSSPAKQNGSACDDANACSVGESCADGVCTGGNAVPTSDGNPCTADSCEPTTGIVTHLPANAGSSCDDGSACTAGDVCDASGSCQPGAPVATDDGDPCTVDSCDPDSGVSHAPAPGGVPCPDDDLCDGTEKCDNFGVCQPGSAVITDDGNACTEDSCESATGTVSHLPLPPGSSCSDDNVCTENDVCTPLVTCRGTPIGVDDGDPCTADGCDPMSGPVVTVHGWG